MAVTTVNLSDTISQWVTKTNTVSTHLGDKSTLLTTDKTSLVHAINEIENARLDSSRTISLVENNLKLLDSARTISLVENSLKLLDSDRIIPLINTHGSTLTENTLKLLDSDRVVSRLQGVVVSSYFNSPVTLTIYDSTGSVLKTIRSPGS